MRVQGMGLVSALGLCLLFGCGDTTSAGYEGDCGPSIRFRGVVYIAGTRVDQTAPKGRTIGQGGVLDCDHRTIVESVIVSTVKRADSRQAIGVRGTYHGVYVAEDLHHAQWPKVVRSK
jgi:hypothetical protein